VNTDLSRIIKQRPATVGPVYGPPTTRQHVLRNLNQSRRVRRTSAPGREVFFNRPSPIRAAAPSTNPRQAANQGSEIARRIKGLPRKTTIAGAGLAVGIYGFSQRSGRGVDKVRGRPTGIFGY
jgi:hypothetical protein